MPHFRTICGCGKVVAQCRCPADFKVPKLELQACDACKQLGVPQTFEQYLQMGQNFDHALRARRNEKGELVFYIHPHGADGYTVDFKVEGNTLIRL